MICYPNTTEDFKHINLQVHKISKLAENFFFSMFCSLKILKFRKQII